MELFAGCKFARDRAALRLNFRVSGHFLHGDFEFSASFNVDDIKKADPERPAFVFAICAIYSASDVSSPGSSVRPPA